MSGAPSIQSIGVDRDVLANPLQTAHAEPDRGYTSRDWDWADFWIGGVMMRTVERWPGFARRTKPTFISLTWRCITNLRANLLLNARRILGDQAGYYAHAALGKYTLGSFYDFVSDIGGIARLGERDLQSRIAEVVGRERYLQARSERKGAILVTAHLGAFETGVAALRQDEPRVHIVFRRDPWKRFEAARAAQRHRLGVIEAHIDDGLPVWMNLRDALLNNEVVLMQGDRVMLGQSGVRVPFLHGHILMPPGPVKLAMMTGAPLIPIFAPRLPDGRVRIVLEEPIQVDGALQESVLRLSRVIEAAVLANPEQWLVLHRAFCEDQVATVSDPRHSNALARRNQARTRHASR